MALFPLGVTVELLINSTWVDISSYVRQRTTMQITGGRSERADTAQPAQLTMELDNRDNRFSPYATGGAYYPFLKRNVQVRVSVTDTSASGNNYSGYRYWGEIHRWPPVNDLSGRDATVTVTANGPLRRIRAHGGKGSALTRYYGTLTGNYAPVAYWPCEEDPDTTIVGAGIDGGTNMSVTVGTPKWKHISDFNGSAPIAVISKSTWDGLTGSFGSSGNDVISAAGTYTWVASTTSVDCRAWGAGGGGSNGSGGYGGGGGEFARASALAVTPGTAYTITVGAGGAGGAGSGSGANGGADGGDTFMAGDSVTVRAHGGKGSASGGAGGTGSTNATHFNGGAQGTNPSNFKGGAGGGSSAGTAAGGNAGSSPVACSGGNGGAAVTGGGAGGHGGPGCANPSQGNPGASPGGGGGGGGDATSGYNWAGGAGAPGQIQLIYTPATQPTTNVIRFIKLTPKHGGNPGKVILRVLTSSSVLARLDVTYGQGGKLRLQGFNGSNVQQFDSGLQSWAVDGQTIMVSAELVNSGANVAWAFKAVIPGSRTLLGSASGTVTTAAVGNVSEVIVSPNADITKTALGHISVQYALVSLRKVSQALNGHSSEMGIDRFLRLANEQALGAIPEFNETSDHWGFETGTQSWVGTNAALTSPTTTFTPVDTDTTPNLTLFQAWPPDGTHSLLLTCNGAGQPSARSPAGTSGQPVSVGDIVSANAEVYCPAAKNNMFIGVLWYQASGAACTHAEDDSADTAYAAGEMKTLSVTAAAPTGAAFFAVKIGDHETPANGQLIYTDNVRVHPRMGPQTRKELHKFMEEIHELDQGILKEAKELWGLKYRTRIRLINQTAAVTLDYTAGTLSPPLAPVIDDKQTKNDVTVHRHKGSKIRVTLDSGDMSVLEPPLGSGRHRHHIRVAAEKDEQLAALAAHLLNLGTVTQERYPTITVNLARAGILNNATAPLMSAIASVEIGDMITLVNLPAWFPSTTVNQQVVGYTETLNAFEWTITWNCIPDAGFELAATAIRRW